MESLIVLLMMVIGASVLLLIIGPDTEPRWKPEFPENKWLSGNQRIIITFLICLILFLAFIVTMENRA